MDSQQTPNDYKEYFLKKFENLFQIFVNDCLSIVKNQEIKSDLNKIIGLLDKLDYKKIISKICSNTKLQEGMAFIEKNNFNDKIMQQVFSSDTKTWTLMPTLHINKIFNQSTPEQRRQLYDRFHALHVCAFTYTKVLESMQTNTDGSFNPFESVGKVAENMDVSTMFNGVEVKTLSAYEMIMEQVLNKEMNAKMNSYMDNIKEDEVTQAADKLTDVLNSDNFNSNKQTSKIIGDLLSKIKDEVINLKNEPTDKVKGKQGVEQLLGIAQKVAGNMMTSIKQSNINVLDLWDATSNLAQKTTNSDALKIVDKLIRSNIENGLKKAQENVNQQNELNESNNFNKSVDNSLADSSSHNVRSEENTKKEKKKSRKHKNN
jgi:hypothetical protein